MPTIIFPTNKKSIVLTVNSRKVYLHIVQCFRRGQGYELLAHVTVGFATWCLVVKSEFSSLVKSSDVCLHSILCGGVK